MFTKLKEFLITVSEIFLYLVEGFFGILLDIITSVIGGDD